MSGPDYGKTFGARRMVQVAGHSKECMFPVVDGPPYGDRWWCGAVSQEGSSYCPEHHAISRVAPKEHIHNRFVRHTEFIGRISK